MRYVSVCSGIEAASVAWEPLGWEPVAFSEIEPFPAAVLKHRWPEVPNHGDMTKHEQWNIPSGSVDLLVGGTPCQSFSVAGLRHGLNDPRGGLMLTFLKIAQRLRPRWVVWENVPGVLSSNGGRDFGSFLGALGELGYGWAYRVLDAQWFGVAQRRRRVFVVGHLGNWELAAKVLFESESVRRDSPPSREAGQGIASNVEEGSRGSKWPASVASTLNAAFGSKQGLEDQHALGGAPLFVPGVICASDGQANASINQNLAPTLTKQDEQPYIVGALDCRIGAQRAQNAQAGHYIADCQPVADTITACFYKHHGAQGGNDSTPKNHIVQSCVIPIHDQATRNAGKRGDKQDGKGNGLGVGKPGDPAPTLTKGDKHAVLYENHPNDSRVTGPHEVAPSCVSRFGTGGGNVPLVQEAVAFTTEQTPKFNKEQALTLTKQSPSGGGQPQCVMAVDVYNQTIDGDVAATLTEAVGGTNTSGAKVMAFHQNASGEVRESESVYALNTNSNPSGRNTGMIQSKMAVRRLTPRECERLQGFPDDHTLIPWRNKPADQCPDGPRYKALGNSMAVPCMKWIGKRIARAENERQRAA